MLTKSQEELRQAAYWAGYNRGFDYGFNKGVDAIYEQQLGFIASELERTGFVDSAEFIRRWRDRVEQG